MRISTPRKQARRQKAMFDVGIGLTPVEHVTITRLSGSTMENPLTPNRMLMVYLGIRGVSTVRPSALSGISSLVGAWHSCSLQAW